ncbi:DUF2357 domain-containing protein [Candidatus Viridilinea mediisalina]|uniref:DUF2357 domain-containing protein n=1 Tax=Candidatus Viridilinea mediisalina TaxID=2024553 RepID=A0A2A6RH03_9CHLR|nr:DUF2357 domain-containing protein [Candidatus Viridilinea mediisalina]PDW02347.1 hypothetical protein CJ255_14440 [Candidatus Viridilinea mediisalina]
MACFALQINGRPLAQHEPLVEGTLVEFAGVPPKGAALHLCVAGVPLEPFLRPTDACWYWRWQVPHAAGHYAVQVLATWPNRASEQVQVQLEVLPRKLAETQYALLLADLQAVGPALLFALQGATLGGRLERAMDAPPPTPAEQLQSLFGAELAQLEAAILRLARRPPELQRAPPRLVAPGELRDFSLLHQAQASPASLEALPEAQAVPSYVSYETQLLRRLLEALWQRLAQLEQQVAAQPALLSQVQQARTRLVRLRDQPFLAGVPPLANDRGASQRLRYDPEYRVVYRYWRRLRERPLLTWDAATLQLPLASLPRLYERWCLLRVALSLLALPGWQVEQQTLLHAHGEAWCLGLPEDRPLLRLRHPDGSVYLLRYQVRYTPTSSPFCSLDRHSRIPDIVVERWPTDGPGSLLVLDAKYRLDAAGGLPEAALADAYSYLGALGRPEGSRACLGVALLYPGRGAALCYASGVAALPLLPGEGLEGLREWLCQFW